MNQQVDYRPEYPHIFCKHYTSVVLIMILTDMDFHGCLWKVLVICIIGCLGVEGQPCITGLGVTATASSTELQVSWSPSDPGCTANEYSLKHELINRDQCQTESGSDVELPVVTGSGVLILGLEPNSVYNVLVTPIINGNNGTPQQQVATTGETAPADSPSNLQNTEQAPTSLGFSWDAVACGSRRGVITGYKYDLTDLSNQQIMASSSTTSKFVMISGLSQSTDYRFQVAAETGAGIGPYVSTDSMTTDLMFPFGESVGDTFIPENDDGGSDEIFLSTLFPYFDDNHDSLYVNTNGVISFLVQVSQYTPDAFPLGDSRRLVAPYWGDVDTSEGGNNSYREILRSNETESLFLKADAIVIRSFVQERRFRAIWMFVATWDQVGYFGTASPHIVNTFQAVLVTNGRHSFTIYNYDIIQWTTGEASDGDALTGLGGIPAQAGFNAGDGMRFHSIQGSRTDDIVNIETTSNVNTPGRWVFRVDEAQIEDRDCITEGSFVTYPIIGSMLGGDIVYISGPCFDSNTQTIKCKFDDEVVSGNHAPNDQATCVTPTVFWTGRVPMLVSVNGGTTYDFQGIFTVVSVDQVTPPKVHVVKKDCSNSPFQAQNSYEVTWDIDVFDGVVEKVDIDILGYSEDGGPSISDVYEIAGDGVMYSTGRHCFILSVFSGASYAVGMIAVTEHGVALSGLKPTLWSEVQSLQWLNAYKTFNPSPLSACGTWTSQATSPQNTPVCPCTLPQALVDVGRFSPHPDCDIDRVADENNCVYKVGAVHCVRATDPSLSGTGQECCYADDDNILSVMSSDGGGYAQSSHHAGVAPFRTSGTIPYLSHFVNDLEPWFMCCVYSDQQCSNYKDVRPSQTCTGYTPPIAAGGSGDPHIQTLDNLSYTFNGLGEYILLQADPDPQTDNDEFILQARTDTLSSSDDATVFVAVAVRQGDSDQIHVEVSNRHVLDVWTLASNINRTNQMSSDWHRLDFEESVQWNLNGVRIFGSDIADRGVLLIFDGGASLELTATQGINRVMSILFRGPRSFYDRTQGLFGTWNDDIEDDLTTPEGVILPANSSQQSIHENFGQLWQIDSTESLFYYREGFSADSYRDESFQPVFFEISEASQDVIDTCGGNEWCIYDLQVTGDMEVAFASRDSYEEQIAVMSVSAQVVICPSLDQIQNSDIEISRSNVGVSVVYTCDDGYEVEGSDERICLETSNWSGDVPICIAICSPPCGDQGSCTAPDTCTCTTGWTGAVCNTAICSTSCGDQGSCTAPDTCTCTTGWTDAVCNTAICSPPCGDQGSCTAPDTCTCTTGWTDAVCNTAICSPLCGDQGSCTAPDMCTCTTGWTDAVCNTAICSLPCGDQGSCTTPDTCTCTTGWTGAVCNTAICSPPCGDQGSCTAPDTCTCTTGWTGVVCNTAICSPPCGDQGSCTAPDMCTCTTGWTGAVCNTAICSPPCRNQGSCTAPDTCTCSTGWTDAVCNTATCNPQCLNGGICTAPNTCLCITGYSGNYCQTWDLPTATCSPQCLNGGICVGPNTCACITGYSGAYCQTMDDQTATSPTIAVSLTFIIIDDQIAVFTPALSDPNSPEYTSLVNQLTRVLQMYVCNSVPGCTLVVITGVGSGSIVVDTMLTFAPGSTSTSADIYRVLANGLGVDGYEIDLDTTQFTTCNPGCENGGVCSATNTCDCTGTGYKGTQCQTTAVCSQPCLNGGSCTADDMCTCTTGYKGSQCEIESDLSAESIGVIIAVVVVIILIITILVTFMACTYKSRQQHQQQYMFGNQYNMGEYFMPGDMQQIRFSHTLNAYMQTRAGPPPQYFNAVGSSDGFMAPYNNGVRIY